MSWSLNENTEWQLSPKNFQKIVSTFDFEPEIDLFASYLNYQVENYISMFLDPKASIIDAFSIDWTNKKIHAYLPFSLIGATLAKIWDNQASGIMIMPWWHTLFWFPLMLKMLQDFPLQLSSNIKLLILPSNKQAIHPLLPQMKLLAVPLSGKQSETEKFQRRLQKLSQSCGDIPQSWNMKQSLKNGNSMHCQGMKIPLNLLKKCCHSYMLCTLKAVYIVGCVKLGVPYLVLYALMDFQSFQTIQWSQDIWKGFLIGILHYLTTHRYGT